MENKTKYYTPGIEEFHVGFEYEYNTDEYLFGLLDRTNGIWKKEKFDALADQDGNTEISDIEKLIPKNEIRVKHLDQKDIEELGWGLWKELEDVQYFRLGKKVISFYPNDLIENIECEGGLLTIKNKSELRKLMQMLQIENENK